MLILLVNVEQAAHAALWVASFVSFVGYCTPVKRVVGPLHIYLASMFCS